MKANRPILALLLCVAAAFSAYAHDIGSHTETDDIAGPWIWDFTPLYTLDGNAQNAPGMNDKLIPHEHPVFMSPGQAGPVFFGQKATDLMSGLATWEELPTKAITIEGWILHHVNQPVGVVAGILDVEDDPSAGWFLGYYDHKFLFGLSSKGGDAAAKGLTILSAQDVPEWKEYWYHVAATYDGASMKLYVNGKLQAESEANSGEILLPGDNDFSIWSYLEPERYMTTGNLLREMRIHAKALSAEEVAQRFAQETALVENGILYEDRMHFTSGPMLQNDTLNSASIIWEIDRPAKAIVRYGKSVPLDQEIAVDGFERLHEVTISDLGPATPYFYEIEATSETGETIKSGNLTFQTAVPADQAYSFAIIGDTETRPHINDHIAKMIWGERPNFLVHVGDLTDGGQKDERFQWTHEYMLGMTQLYSRIPVFPVPGNGESDLYWYSHYHALPGHENYYKFSFGNADFFMLDSNRDFSPGSEQYRWLEEELAKSTAEWKFAAHHHPAYTSDENDYGDTWEGPSEYGDKNVMNLVPLYEKYGVDVVFFGHLHTYERSWPIKNGEVTPGGVTYVQTGGAGGNLENAAPGRTWFMNKFLRDHHYCIVKVHKNTFSFAMYDLEGRLKDTFELTK